MDDENVVDNTLPEDTGASDDNAFSGQTEETSPEETPAGEPAVEQEAVSSDEAAAPTQEAAAEVQQEQAEGSAVATAVGNIVGIRFRNSGKTYCFDAGELELSIGDRVVVESDLGINIGQVAKKICELKSPEQELKRVLRKVTEVDLNQEAENEAVKLEARQYGMQRIEERKLPMKLLATEVTLDRKRFIFYFVADTRIDFRDLVKDLASKFRTRIELRQIGVRDAAKMVGGFGICGQELCCKTWLRSFAPISIKMAKQQDLVLNTCKLSGLCGRLMCCLNYEYDPNFKKRKPQKKQEPTEQEKQEAMEKELTNALAYDIIKVRDEPADTKAEDYSPAPAKDIPDEADDKSKLKRKRRKRGGRGRGRKGDAPRQPRQDGQPGPSSEGGSDAPRQQTSHQEGGPASQQRTEEGAEGAGDKSRKKRRRRPRRKKKPSETSSE